MHSPSLKSYCIFLLCIFVLYLQCNFRINMSGDACDVDLVIVNKLLLFLSLLFR